MEIKSNENILSGELIDMVQLNKIARKNEKSLNYLMNVMDDETTNVYMWFKNIDTDKNYFIDITK